MVLGEQTAQAGENACFRQSVTDATTSYPFGVRCYSMKTQGVLALLWVLSSVHVAAAEAVPKRVTLSTDAGEITFLAASANNRYLAAASLDSYVFIWETSSWKRVARIPPEPPPRTVKGEHQDEFSAIHGLAFSPDNHTVAFASAGVLYSYDIRSGIKHVRGQTNAEALAFTPEGEKLVASTPRGAVEIWATRTWRKRAAAIPVQDPGLTSGAVSVSSDAAFAAVSGHGGVGILSLRTLHTEMLPLLTTTRQQVRGGNQVSISSDSRLVASGVSSFDNHRIVVWDVRSKVVAFSTQAEAAVWAVAFSPDSSRLFAGQAKGKILAWDTSTWKQICSLDSRGAYQFAVSSQWLAAGGGERTVTIIPLQECVSTSSVAR